MYYMSSVHSPDGSYTEDPSTETVQFKSRSTEFDDDFDDEEPLPTIGTCKALYPFEGSSRNFKGDWIAQFNHFFISNMLKEPFISSPLYNTHVANT